ncbi:MAG: ferredoxin-thioredoxin reductase catalytic domain-containing protein [Phormidesmis sp.]
MSTSKPLQGSDKSLEIMRNFAQSYAKRTGTYFCQDLGVTAVVIEGLAKHKDDLGAPLCPCRHYEDKEAEVKATYWNCPCVPMQERQECHCMLFLTEDNPFSGTEQKISFEQIREETSAVKS